MTGVESGGSSDTNSCPLRILITNATHPVQVGSMPLVVPPPATNGRSRMNVRRGIRSTVHLAIDVTRASIRGHQRVWPQRARHLDAIRRIVVDELRRDYANWRGGSVPG
jgi:hypothetical protein